MDESPMAIVLDILIIIAVIFIFPIIWAAQKGDYLSHKSAETIAYEFCSNVSSRGYIDDTVYKEFTEALSATGGLYEVSLTHKQTVCEPEYSGGVFTGDVMTYAKETYTGDIRDEIYYWTGAYIMSFGDVFEVSIWLATDGLAQDLTKASVGTSTTGFYKSSQAVTGVSHSIQEKYVN